MNSLKRKIPVASFLCHNFGIPVDPLAPFTAFDETRNQLGLYPDASRYDDGIAFGLAKAAAATYKDEKPAKEALRVSGYLDAQIDYFQKDSHVGMVIVDEETVVIAFRGTDPGDWGDWRTNLKILPDLSATWVHSGFNQALNTLWSDVYAVIDRESNERAIFLTGHSMGGAIATLAAVRLESAGIRVAGLYTFGQPPVGGQRFAERAKDLRSKYLRLVNHVDMVVDLPSGARHVGEVRYFDVFGRMYDREPFCQTLYDSMAAPAIEAGAEWLVHGAERYAELLKARQ